MASWGSAWLMQPLPRTMLSPLVVTATVSVSADTAFADIYAGDDWYIDLLGNRDEQIVIGEDGWADFTCNGNSVSVWVPKEN